MGHTYGEYPSNSALQDFERVRIAGNYALRSLMDAAEVERRSRISGYALLGAVSVATKDDHRPWEEFVLFRASWAGSYALAFAAAHPASRPSEAAASFEGRRSVTVIPIDELAKLVQLNHALEAADAPFAVGAQQEHARRTLRMRVIDRNTEAVFGRKYSREWPELDWERVSRRHFIIRVNRFGMAEVVDLSINGTYIRRHRRGVAHHDTVSW